jgi:dihydrofolate reductase
MRKIFLHIMVSLDGYIDGPDGEMDWHFVDAEFEDYVNDMLGSIDGIIFGRKAFELLAQYWPAVEADPAIAADAPVPAARVETARLMNRLPKYVLSNTLRRTEWANSYIVGGDIAAEAAKLKAMPGKDIALFAGSGAAMSFLRAGLLDEIKLVVNPVVLGGGTPLFSGGYARSNFRLLSTRPFRSGAMLLDYRPG